MRVRFGPKSKIFTGPLSALCNLRRSSLRVIDARAFSPTGCPLSSRNGCADFNLSAATSCALLQTIKGVVPIAHLANAQKFVGIADDLRKRRHDDDLVSRVV